MGINLIDLIAPAPNSVVMILDVHASESGALAILDDLYKQIRAYKDKSVHWIMVVSVPEYQGTKNIVVERYPWVKKSWIHRGFFDAVITRKIVKRYQPDQVFSLQNKGLSFFRGRQLVYLHLPFVLTDHRFRIRLDGKKLWLYQNVIRRSIFHSLRSIDATIVQTHWMKNALISKAGIPAEKIILQQPDVSCNGIGVYEDIPENRKRLFYPATAFTYKNHMTLLKALKYAQKNGFHDYELILTIEPDENEYSRRLHAYAQANGLSVIFGGRIPREKVFEMYTKSVLVFPSYVESFGLPLLEARLTGSPVIASDTPFCREILGGYKKAVYFPEMDEQTLGEYILKICCAEGTEKECVF